MTSDNETHKTFESTGQINVSQRSVDFQRLDKLHKTIITHATAYKPKRDQSSSSREPNTTSYRFYTIYSNIAIHCPAMCRWNVFSQSAHSIQVLAPTFNNYTNQG